MAFLRFKLSAKMRDKESVLRDIERAYELIKELEGIVRRLSFETVSEVEIKDPTECESDGSEVED